MGKDNGKDSTQLGGSVALTRPIAGNVAAATASSTSNYCTSQTRSKGTLGSRSYRVTLGETVPLSAVCKVLRKGLKNGTTIREQNSDGSFDGYRRIAGIHHWFNLFLDLKFNKYYKNKCFPYKDFDVVYDSMSAREFYILAKKHYGVLTSKARLNFAKVSPIGLHQLVVQKLLLTTEQWLDQLDEQWELGKKLSDRGALTQFFNNLTKNNQSNLKEALKIFAARSPENLEAVLNAYDISASDYDAICRMATMADIRFCNKNVDNVSDLMAFLAKLSPISRMAVLESNTFKDFQGEGQGILSVFWHREFPVDGCTYREMLAFMNKHLDLNASDFFEKRERVIAKFGLVLIADYEHTMPAMATGGDLEALYSESPWLQKIIVECAKKKAFDAVADQNGHAPFFTQVEDMSFASDSEAGVTLRFKPPSYEDLLVSARSFVQSNPLIAVQTFCQAMNTHKEDDTQSSRKARKIAELERRLQSCELEIEEFDRNYQRERQIVEKAQLDALDDQKVKLYQQRDRYVGQLNRARMMVVPLEERAIDPKVLKLATDLAKEQAMTDTYPRLIEFHDRYVRQQMNNIDSLGDKVGLLLRLSELELERIHLIRESRSQYVVPAFVTNPQHGLADLTEHYLGELNRLENSGAASDSRVEAILTQLAEAWLLIARSAPISHLAQKALSFIMRIKGPEAYGDVLGLLDAFPSGHSFKLTCLKKLLEYNGSDAYRDVMNQLASFPQEASRQDRKQATLLKLALTLSLNNERRPSHAALKKCFVFPSSHASGCLGSLFYPPRRDASFHRAFATALHDWDEERLLSYLNTNVSPLSFEANDLPRLRKAFPKPKPIVVHEPLSSRKKYLIAGGVASGLAAASATVMVLSTMNVITLPNNLVAGLAIGALILFVVAVWAFSAAKNEAPAQKLSDSKATVLGTRVSASSEQYVDGVPVVREKLPIVRRQNVDDPHNRLGNLAMAQQVN